MHEAVRTCVVCRSSAPKEQLIRFVRSEVKSEENGRGEISCDLFQVLPGRGAYCHPELNCVFGKEAESRLAWAVKASGGRKVKKSRPKRIKGEHASAKTQAFLDTTLVVFEKAVLKKNVCSKTEIDFPGAPKRFYELLKKVEKLCRLYREQQREPKRRGIRL